MGIVGPPHTNQQFTVPINQRPPLNGQHPHQQHVYPDSMHMQMMSNQVYPPQQMLKLQQQQMVQAHQQQQYQYIQVKGNKPQMIQQQQYQNQANGINMHQKTVSNGSSITYPFQTASISAHPIAQSHQKPQRPSQLFQEQVVQQLSQGGKHHALNDFLAQTAEGGVYDQPSPSLTSIQHQKQSPSPRSRHIKIQYIGPNQMAQQQMINGVSLQIGSNSIMSQQSRSHQSKAVLQTDPKSPSEKQKEAMEHQNAVAVTNFTLPFGSPSQHQQTKDEKDMSKRTITEGFSRAELEANSPMLGQQQPSRAQTGIQRRFYTHKNPQPINGVLQTEPGNIHQQYTLQQDQQNNIIVEQQFDEETLKRIYEAHGHNFGPAEKNQIMQLYRMSIQQQQQHQQLDHTNDQFIRVNQMLGNDFSSPDKKRLSGGVVGQQYIVNQRSNQSSAKTGTQAPPRSAASSNQQQAHYNGIHVSNTSGTQGTGNGSGNNHQTRRESYNFVSQQQKQSMNSQEKLRRNLSKEYCPMIIKSTNKSIQGANNAQIVKGVLQQSKTRVESSLKKGPITVQQQSQQRGQQGIPIAQQNSEVQWLQQQQLPSEILKTQSHQLLTHQQTANQSNNQQRFQNKLETEVESDGEASPIIIGSPKNNFIDNKRLQKSLDLNHTGAQNGEEPPKALIKHEEGGNDQNPNMVFPYQVTPTRADNAQVSNTQNVLQSHSQQAINDQIPYTIQVMGQNGELSPSMSSPMRSNDIVDKNREPTEDHQNRMNELPARQGSHLQQIQLMSSMGGRQNHNLNNNTMGENEVLMMDQYREQNSGSALASSILKSPGPLGSQQQHIIMKKDMSVQQQNHVKTNLLSSKNATSSFDQTPVSGIPSGHATTTSVPHINNRARLQQQQQSQQQRQSAVNHPQIGSSVPNSQAFTQYKLVTPSQEKSKAGRMQQQTPHQTAATEQKAMRVTMVGQQAQRTAGVRGSSMLAQNSTTNNNANSQSNHGGAAGKQHRTGSHNRQIAGVKQDVSGASTTTHGGFLRPKVLDFQPKTGQVDPLQQHRSRKRQGNVAGTASHNHSGAAGHNHNQTPAINMSTSSAFNQQNQHQYGAARFNNAGSGVFRHF